ncbi:MAG: adenylate/guanylate cyclase domain-containing protein, partial [Pseudomonadota bacterium]
MHPEKIRGVIDWLSDGARSESDPPLKMQRTCERLVAAGMPLHRVGVFVETLHPDIYGHRFIWRADGEVEVGSTTEDVEQSEDYLRSPLKILYDHGVEVRFRLDDPESARFPFLDDLRAEAVTDY